MPLHPPPPSTPASPLSKSGVRNQIPDGTVLSEYPAYRKDDWHFAGCCGADADLCGFIPKSQMHRPDEPAATTKLLQHRQHLSAQRLTTTIKNTKTQATRLAQKMQTSPKPHRSGNRYATTSQPL